MAEAQLLSETGLIGSDHNVRPIGQIEGYGMIGRALEVQFDAVLAAGPEGRFPRQRTAVGVSI
ncbi:MAG TPA: hypothetical protein VMR39_14020 [Sphingobium sp.]|nr:hypothetical protein [Sphingobium sp.]HUD92692.1 hypothetical protein [Sphingobium sp.]